MSLVVFVVPNVVGLGVWVLGDNLPTLLHSLTAIMSWVVSFGLSSVLFWKLVQVAFRNRPVQP
jgi:cytosine/uracil/thiamine/allantoin permease